MRDFSQQIKILTVLAPILISVAGSHGLAGRLNHNRFGQLLSSFSDRDCSVSDVQTFDDRTEFTITKGRNGFRATINQYDPRKAKFTGNDASDEFEFESRLTEGELRGFKVEVYRYTYSTNSGKSDWRIVANTIECGQQNIE